MQPWQESYLQGLIPQGGEAGNLNGRDNLGSRLSPGESLPMHPVHWVATGPQSRQFMKPTREFPGECNPGRRATCKDSPPGW